MAKTALVIDNDENTIVQISEALGGLGYTVTSASEAAAGTEMATNEPPSIMLVNLATPGSNGLELCKTIHNTDNLKEIPIILLTLREGKFDPVYVKLYGIVAFLKKPFEDDALLELVGEHSIATEDEVVEEAISAAADEIAIDEGMDTDATMTFDASDYADDAVSVEDDAAGGDYDATVITEATDDLGSLQESFSQPDYSDDDNEADDGSFSIDADADSGFDAGGFDADAFDADADTVADAGEGFDAGGFDADADTDADAGEGFDAGGFDADADTVADAGEGFDAGGFDAGADTVADAGEGFDAGGFDAGADATDSTDASWGDVSSPTSDEDDSFDAGGGFGTEGGGEDESWGISGDLSMDETTESEQSEETPAEEMSGGMVDAFATDSSEVNAGGGFDGSADESFDAAANGDDSFDADGTMTFDTGGDDSFDAGGGDAFDSGGTMAAAEDADDSFADGADSFGDDAFGDDSFGGADSSFDGGGADLDTVEDTADVTGESAEPDEITTDAEDGDFGGDDYDYTGLFDAEDSADDGKKSKKGKKKKKKKKGFKKGGKSKSLVALLVLLLIAGLGGGAFYFKDEIPKDLISKIPFLSDDKPKKAPVAKRPGRARRPAPAKDTAPTEAAAPEKVTPEPVAKTAPQKAADTKPAVKKQAPVQAKKAPVKDTSVSAGMQKGKYYVQFGVFSKSANADRLARQLGKIGHKTIKHSYTDRQGRKLTYVLLDRAYKTKGSTEKRARGIKSKTGFDTAVYRH